MGRRTLAAIVTAVLVLSAAAPAMAAVAAPAGAPEGDVQHFLDEQTVVRGFFRGRTIRYLDLGAVKLAPGNTVGPDLGRHERDGNAAEHHRRRSGAGRLHAALARHDGDVEAGLHAADAEVGGRGARCRSGGQGHAASAPGSSSTARCSASTSPRPRLLQGPEGRVPRSGPRQAEAGEHGGADLGGHERHRSTSATSSTSSPATTGTRRSGACGW